MAIKSSASTPTVEPAERRRAPADVKLCLDEDPGDASTALSVDQLNALSNAVFGTPDTPPAARRNGTPPRTTDPAAAP